MSVRNDGDIEVERLVLELAMHQTELEWIEFKENNADPQQIGEYISALSNSAVLHGQSRAFLVWGVQDGTHQIVGTRFSPATATKGGEQLIAWLSRLLSPRIDFAFHTGQAKGSPVVVLEVPAAEHMPIRFSGEEFIRVGSSKRKLRDFPEKERKLWNHFSRTSFEEGVARGDASETEILSMLDFASYFDLVGQPVPATHSRVVERLADERFVRRNTSGRYDITNLGAITFGKPLQRFSLERKAVRIIVYPASDRMNALREREAAVGYASGFAELMRFIHSQIPANELVGEAFRREAPLYPELAVRELVANALIHQDFSIRGTGPMVEILKAELRSPIPAGR